MIFKDYYKILGLETNKVSLEDIKIAYRDSAKKYHPDLNKEDRISEEKFKEISEAYQILSKTSSKRKYDRSWNYYIGRKKKAYNISEKNITAKPKDFFNMFFGNQVEDKDIKLDKKVKIKTPRKGENIETEIEISIVDAFFGKEKSISLKNIDGSTKTFNVKIPKGIQNNEKIRLIGQGKKGINGGKDGDLIINIVIKNNSRFELEGLNLKTNINISPWEAALSTKLVVTGIEDDITLNIPKGIQSGEEIIIKNMGYKNKQGVRGDLVVKANISIPKELSKEEEELFKKMQQISKFNPRL